MSTLKLSNAIPIGCTLLLGLVVLWLHSPFQLPVSSDRAYLLYISQTAWFTGDIYRNSGFGYTPLAPLIAAGWFALASLASDASTVMLVRIAGMACWLACLLGALLLGRLFFRRWPEALLMATIFAGFAVVPMMSAINLEPKMLVLLFQFLALASVYQRRCYLAGLAVALAAMCWQPAIVIAPALALFLWLDAPTGRTRALLQYAAGGISGTLPVLIYLAVTESWALFWQQAVLRKLELEGAVLFEQPTHWMTMAQVSQVSSELWLFLAAGLGVLLFLLLALAARAGRGPQLPRHSWLMLLFTLAWAIFNSMEFQSVPDLVPFLPALVYWPVLLLSLLRSPAGNEQTATGGAGKLRSQAAWALGLLAVILALHDLPRTAPQLTLAEQRQQLAPLAALDRPLMTFDFEEFHVLEERTLPTKFVRFNVHDDFLIERTVEGGCAAVIEQVRRAAPGAFALRLRGPQRSDRSGHCAKRLLKQLAMEAPIREFAIDGNLPCIDCVPRVDTIVLFAPVKRASTP